jgi:hypothetical protein
VAKRAEFAGVSRLCEPIFYDAIRDLFAQPPLSEEGSYKAGRFSLAGRGWSEVSENVPPPYSRTGRSLMGRTPADQASDWERQAVAIADILTTG